MLQAIWDFICEVVEGFRRLHFRRTGPKYRPLPDYVRREEVAGPGGTLELLVCEPTKIDPKTRPVLFLHGAFGHASVFLEWMGFLRQHYGARTYSLSFRGHGASYHPSSYFRMVFLTKHDDLARELLAVIDIVRQREGTDPILVGHSSGGGMYQYVLAKGMTTTPALGLIGHIPHFGVSPMLDNWMKFDRLMVLRGIIQLQHPKSNISTPRMMHNAFFGPDFTIEQAEEFGEWSADYECLWWPMQYLSSTKNGQPMSLDTKDIVRGIDSSKSGDRVLILMGASDRLMAGTTERGVAEYRSALQQLNEKAGVRHVEIARAGHHVQNDVQWEEAAEALLDWLRQV